MTQRLLTILVSLWLPSISSLSAQVGFTLPALNYVSPGVYITVPVTVSNFDSIFSTQFTIQWDSSVLEFDQVLSYNLPMLVSDNFGLGDILHGKVRFAYEAPNFNTGVSKSDGSAIFRLSFYVNGHANDFTALTIAGDQTTEFEVGQVGHAALTIDSCEIQNGFVAVGYMVGTVSPEAATLPVQISPNPFSSATRVFIDLKTSEMVHIILTDSRGKVLEEKKIEWPAGQHGMEIASDQLRENGIYFLILRTATHSCIRSLVKL